MRSILIRLLSFCTLFFVYDFTLSQNVGIGVADPAYKLDVGGRLRIRTGTIGNNSTSSGFWMEDFRNGNNRIFFGMQDSIRAGFYGTGGVGWAFNFNATNGDVGITDGSLGIGTITPLYDLYLYRPDPGIGFFDSGENHSSGSIIGDSTDLVLNAYRRSSIGSNDPGDLILQVNSGGIPNFLAGNVGIGTFSPDEKLHVSGNLKLQASSAKMIFANNTADKGSLYLTSNDIKLGTASGNATGRVVISTNNTDQLAVNSTGEVNRLTQTGNADILPIAYARVNSSGTLLSGGGIESVTKEGTGQFSIRITGEDISVNPNAYTVVVTPVLSGADDFTFPSVRIRFVDDDLRVELGKFEVNFQNHSDCGCPEEESNSYINNQAYFYANTGFSLVVYKQ